MPSLVLKVSALFLIILLMLSVVNSVLVSGAEVSKKLVPHEDPAKASEEIDTLTLLTLYLYIISLTSMEKYEDAKELIEQVKEFKVTEELKYIVSRFNEILAETHRYLNSTKKYINLAKYFISIAEFKEAYYAMDNAIFCLVKANTTYDDLKQAHNRIISVLKKETPEEILGKFYQIALTNNMYLKRIDELIKEYHEEILKLKSIIPEEPEEFKGFYETKITIKAEPKLVVIGNNITLYGKLSTLNNEPLPGREIVLNIMFKRKVLFKTTLVTNSSGFFTCKYMIPYIYDKDIMVSGLLIIASYTPKNDDLKFYKPCSNMTTVIALFNETRVSVKGPLIVYPGLKFKFTINISPPPTEGKPRFIEVWIDNSFQEAFKVSTNNIVYELKILENISVGTHILMFKVKPSKNLAPAIGGYGVLVTYIPVRLDLSVPKLSYYPFSKIRVRGKIFIANGTFLSGEQILINVDGKNFNVFTNPYGEFSLDIDPAFTITFKEFAVNVMFKPEKPWFPKILRKEEVRVISLLPLFFALASLIFYIYAPPREVRASLSRILELLRRRRMPRKTIEKPSIKPYTELEIETYARKPITYAIKVTPTDIVKLYIEAVKLISEKTFPPKPYETMREYWQKIQGKIPEHVGSAFKTLTVLAEKAVYFKPEFTDEEFAAARKCYEEILKW